MKTRLLPLLFILILVSVPFSTFADGFVIEPLPEGDWNWTGQNSQQAFINYQNDREKLIIAVDIEKRDSDAVWIIPIPSKPEEMEVDITSDTPVFFGDNISSKAKLALSDSFSSSYGMAAAGQIWTLPYFALVSLGGARGGGKAEKMPADLVAVETHIEKEGMVAEIITAKKAQALYNYLKNKELNIAQGSIPVLDSYIGKEYTFIVSWISSSYQEETGGETRGIYASFPVSKNYYPLYPTSVYGEKKIPITIRVVGYVKPKLFSEIEPYTDIQYFTERTDPPFGNRIRCISYASQMRGILELYRADHDAYPSSLRQLREYGEMIDSDLFQEMKEICWGPVFYQGDKDSYQAKFHIYPGKIYTIDSSGIAQEEEVKKGEALYDPSLQDFYQDTKVWQGKDEYTKITINAPAKLLKKDLWMEKGKPLSTSIALLVINNSFIISLAFYFLIAAFVSFLAAGIVGWICFRKFKKYALLGLTNVFTLIAFYFALRHTETEKPGRCSKKKFLFFFSLLFVLLLWLLRFMPVKYTGIEEGWAMIILLGWILLGGLIWWIVNFFCRKFGVTNKVLKVIFFIVIWALVTWVITSLPI